MTSKTFVLMVSAAALVAGKTPSGFTPTSNTDLIVTYGQTVAMNGAVVDKAATASEPTIATTSQLTGTSYAVIMVDLDIPSTTNPHTFLHWMQTDLTPSTSASTVTTANGTTQAFTLTNTKATAAIVNYTQPNPPAQNPLSHRYTQVLVDTSTMSTAALNILMTAAQSRVGFDVNTVLQNASLTTNVVAGNSFNVTNPGPATAAAAASNSTASAGTGANGNAAAATNSTTTAGSDGKKGGKKGGKGGANAKGGNSTAIAGAAAAQATGNGSKNGTKGAGGAKATQPAGNTPSSAAGLPAATGSTLANNLTGAAAGKNGTGTVSVSGAKSTFGLMMSPISSALLAGLLGASVYAL